MWGKAAATLSVAGLTAACAALVTVWALAAPARDPLGDALGAASARLRAVTDWYAQGPGGGRPTLDAMRAAALGDAGRGRRLMTEYGCGACHLIPGVAGARGTVGPSLHNLVGRAYIAGVLTNTPGDLSRWLMNPPLFSPQTAMPDLGVEEADAADMAAYLLTLGADA
ncbi:c-type cytochrome [Anianabacter salinae]|uniref:c-type cytochrome n=1 Tax=Anianabacter salinae TaxID=2851023 RepID=UPI00225E621C|nr:c-type cytochrome [Anianabacter salinae]MBV0911190.1 c-type cytochrome [Anianabacter salinae]